MELKVQRCLAPVPDGRWYGMVWHGMAEVCEGAPVAVSGWDVCDCAVTDTCNGMVWHGMVDVCDGCLAAEASGSSFG